MTLNTNKSNGWVGALFKFAIPLIISVGLCWLLFRDFNLADMWRVIKQECRPQWLVAGFAFAISAQVCRALRWRIQLRALGIDAPLFTLVLSVFGTYAVNLVFPRLGEVWRCGYVARRTDSPFTTVFGSMVADRLADTVSVALIALLAFVLASGSILAYLTENQEAYRHMADLVMSPWPWLALAACVGGVWWFLRRRTENRLVVKIQTAVRQLWQGFAAVFSMPGKGVWLLLTAGIWISYFTQMYLGFYSFDFTAGLIENHGWVAALVTFVISSIAMGVPSNGGIGPWQWAVMFATGIYGLSRPEAAAFANMQLGGTTLLTIVLGLFTFACIALQKKRSLPHPNNESHV